MDRTSIQFDPKQTANPVIQVDLAGEASIALVWCPAGEFLMGSPNTDHLADDFEKPQHKVSLSQGYWIGQKPVTQQQWLLLMEPDTILSSWGGDLPAYGMTWDSARDFCSRLTTLLQGKNLLNAHQLIDLPTEAQWEYACRAGTRTRWHFGDVIEQLDAYAWFKDNTNGLVYPVGIKGSNPWQLYDCYGSVSEWCIDDFATYPQIEGGVVDPCVIKEGSTLHTVRGGNFLSPARWCSSSYREFIESGNPFNDPTGIRVVCIEK